MSPFGGMLLERAGGSHDPFSDPLGHVIGALGPKRDLRAPKVPRVPRRDSPYKIVKTFWLIWGSILGPRMVLFRLRPESVSRVASGRLFGPPPGRLGTARGALEHVIYGVNSMSRSLILTRSLEPPGSNCCPFWDPLGDLLGRRRVPILGVQKKTPGVAINRAPGNTVFR